MQESQTERRCIAYFCMEVALAEPNSPSYSGGLGVLAGDTLRSAADLGLPMVGVSLFYRQGYFRQRIDSHGVQGESPDPWNPESSLSLMPQQVSLSIEGRTVQVRAWRFLLSGVRGHAQPIYFLDTDWAANHPLDRGLTGQLYGGDQRYRLCQQVVLGLGGVAMLRELGHDRIAAYHMNEGHSALLTLALLEEQLDAAGGHDLREHDVSAVRDRCVFTTHTPVPAAMDRYSRGLVESVLGKSRSELLCAADGLDDGELNMTALALRFSRYINGVAMSHGQVARGLFPQYPINSITNGVHAATWTSPPFAALFDRHVPEWRLDNLYLRYAISISSEEILRAHAATKERLLAEIEARTHVRWSDKIMTIGFARRATAYKRADLLFSDPNRLRTIARQFGGLQLVFGGKAHPADLGGKEVIRRVIAVASAVGDPLRMIYLENYDIDLARVVTAGSDLWLNTPLRPYEASGTSGMKAALNGVPSLSVLDGWWVEGCIEGVTGWAIDNGHEAYGASAESDALYDKLERVVLPLYCGRPMAYAEVMRHCIALNGSFFNTQRMLSQYVANAYRLEESEPDPPAVEGKQALAVATAS